MIRSRFLFLLLFLFLPAGLRGDDNTPPRVPTKIDKIIAPTGRTHTQIGTKLRFLNNGDKTDFATYIGAGGGGSGDMTLDGTQTVTGAKTFEGSTLRLQVVDEGSIGLTAPVRFTSSTAGGVLVTRAASPEMGTELYPYPYSVIGTDGMVLGNTLQEGAIMDLGGVGLEAAYSISAVGTGPDSTVTLDTSSDFVGGQPIFITGAQGFTPDINGPQTVGTVISPTQFTLSGVNVSVSGISLGQVYARSMGIYRPDAAALNFRTGAFTGTWTADTWQAKVLTSKPDAIFSTARLVLDPRHETALTGSVNMVRTADSDARSIFLIGQNIAEDLGLPPGSGDNKQTYLSMEHRWDAGNTSLYGPQVHALTGTISITGKAATSSAGIFDVEVRRGETIQIGGATYIIDAIASTTDCTVTVAAPSPIVDQSANTGWKLLTGTVDATADSTTITGTGTLFLDELGRPDGGGDYADRVGPRIFVAGESHYVKTITSNTSLTLWHPMTATANDVTIGTGGLIQDEMYFGLSGTRVLSLGQLANFPYDGSASLTSPLDINVSSTNKVLDTLNGDVLRIQADSNSSSPGVLIRNLADDTTGFAIVRLGLRAPYGNASANPIGYDIYLNGTNTGITDPDANTFGIYDPIGTQAGGAGWRFFIKANGNVGIGTTTPATKLDVNGTVTATAFAGALSGNVLGDVTGNVSGNAGTVTVANEVADTTNFLVFANSATGANALKTNAGLTFDASTGTVSAQSLFATTLSAQSFSATTGAVNLSPTTAGLTIFPTFGSGAIDNCVIGANYVNIGNFSTLTGTSSLTLGVAGPAGTAGTIRLKNATSTGTTTLANANVSATNYTATLQAATGTIAYLTDIPAGGVALGDTPTWTGAHTFSRATDATTVVNGITLATSTAATVGAQKWSPFVVQSANGWGTTAGTSQAVKFQFGVKPTQGGSPTGTWALQSSINGAAFSDVFYISNTGNAHFNGSYFETNDGTSFTGSGGYAYIGVNGGSAGVLLGRATPEITSNSHATAIKFLNGSIYLAPSGKIQFQGTTSSFAGLYSSGTGLTAGLADGTAGGSFTASGTLSVTGVSTHTGGSKVGATVVGSLPSAAANTYLELIVTDSLAPVVGATVAAGGSAKAKVISNGTNWIVTATL